MDWLTQLLNVEAPPGTRLAGWPELHFRSGHPLLIAAPAVLLFAGAAFALYFRERGRVGPVRRSVMAALRVGVLGLLLAMVLRPFLLVEFEGERPRGVAVVIDNTQSLQQEDYRAGPADRIRAAIAAGLVPLDTPVSNSAVLANVPEDRVQSPTRLSLVRGVLGHPELRLLPRLGEVGPVQPYLFGTQLRGVASGEGGGEQPPDLTAALLQGLDAEQSRTALADSLMEILSRKDSELPGAVVVVTDGRDNASKYLAEEAAAECARFAVPLHIYGVGTSEGGTLQLVDMNVPGTVFYDDKVTVPVRWRSQGFEKGAVRFELVLGGTVEDGQVVGGEVVDSKEVPVKAGTDLREELSFTPKKEGDAGKDRQVNLSVRVSLKGSEQFRDAMTRSLRLSDSKVRILYIEDTPRWEYKFLQPALIRDRRVQADFLLAKADPRLLQAGPPFLASFPRREELLKYDLIILGDVPASYLGKERMELIREYVRDFRGGLILIAGRLHNPADYDGTPLAEVFPVEFLAGKAALDPDARPQAFNPVLTKAGETSEMLALADTPEENRKVWQGLPGFYWNFPVTGLRPAATALLVHPTKKMGDRPMPVLATQYYGRGQVLFLGTDETWRWRYNAEEKYFTRFWGQVIYQLALPHLLGDSSSRLQVALERSEAVLGREGAIYARLLDEGFRPRTDAEVQGTLVALDAKPGEARTQEVTLHSLPGRPGEYRVYLANDRPGNFELQVRGMPGSFQYRVTLPPRHELEKAGLAEETLREMARVSGGRFYREEDLEGLPRQVERRLTPFTLRQEILLWNPLMFVLFVGLITAEWLMRKFANLS